MKSYTHYLTFNTRQRRELVRITDRCSRLCKPAARAKGCAW